MANLLRSWADDRTGVPALIDRAASEPVKGGARLRYVLGSSLAAAFLVQMATGLLLMTGYVPSSSQAWGSVWYMNTQLSAGWFIRGLHHWGSSAVVILLALHLVQTICLGAYRAPREFNWWLGLMLMQVVLGLALTGYLLPWDQKGYWATRVATGIAGSTPVIGPAVQTVIVGGSEYGNQTLTHLYGLHVGVLPWLVGLLLLGHFLLARRHGLTASGPAERTESYYPGQAFWNLLSIAVVLGILVGVVLYLKGAPLEAPADPSSTDYPARPEWYFLFLYQLLNKFESPYEIIGTMIIPGAVMTVLALLPLLDKVLPRRLLHFGACGFIFAIMGGIGYLMVEAVSFDERDPAFQAAVVKHHGLRERASQLAEVEGVPPDGSVYVLRRDPLTQGRATLESKCLSCHAHDGRGQPNLAIRQPTAEELSAAKPLDGGLGSLKLDGNEEAIRRVLGALLPAGFKVEESRSVPSPLRAGRTALEFVGASAEGPADVALSEDLTTARVTTYSKPSASDLKGFGSRAWLLGLLTNPSDPRYFGLVPQCNGMAKWKEGSELTEEELGTIADFFEKFVATADPAMSPLVWESSAEVQNHPGYELFSGECANCHAWGQGGADSTGVNAPNLYGWGSDAWLRRMVLEPGAVDLYGYLPEHQQMPSFQGQITDEDLRTMTRYLRGDYVAPMAPESGPQSDE